MNNYLIYKKQPTEIRGRIKNFIQCLQLFWNPWTFGIEKYFESKKDFAKKKMFKKKDFID